MEGHFNNQLESGCSVTPSSIICDRRYPDGEVKPSMFYIAKTEGNHKTASQTLDFQVVLQVFPAVALL